MLKAAGPSSISGSMICSCTAIIGQWGCFRAHGRAVLWRVEDSPLRARQARRRQQQQLLTMPSIAELLLVIDANDRSVDAKDGAAHSGGLGIWSSVERTATSQLSLARNHSRAFSRWIDGESGI